MAEKNRKNRMKIIKVGLLAALTVLVVLGGVAFAAYRWKPQNRFVRLVETVIPFPVAMVSWNHWIPLSDFRQNVDSLRRFYENQDFSQVGMRVDFSTADGQKRLRMKEKEVLSKMIEDKAIEVLARKEGILVDAQKLNDNVDKKIKEYGTEEAVRESLDKLYGWKIEDFKERVVKPALYQEELRRVFEEKYQKKDEARERINEAARALADKRLDFSAAVKQYSDGDSAEADGELGWFRRDQIVPEIADQIFSLKKGESSQVLESSLGFHIVGLEERKKEGDTEMVRIRQIFAAKGNFVEWLIARMQEMKVRIVLPGYAWNADKGQVEFKDQALTDFEKKAKNDPQGDVSVIF